jgi:hypothetical protein
MANPTTYFGWVMPNSADLVTDLPADFNVFGQGVDTSMQFLLGGTTGQVLSKTSATNMAFTWINNDQGDITAVTAGTGISGGGTSGAVTITNSMATEITAKADLIVGTGNAAFDNLAVGTNGQVLTADSTVSPTGLKWATPAGGGGFTLINRTSFSNVASTTTSFDGVFTSTYETYYVVVESIGCGSPYTDDMQLQMRYAGPTTQITNYFAMSYGAKYDATALTFQGVTAGAQITLWNNVGGAGYLSQGIITVTNVGNGSRRPLISGYAVNGDGHYGPSNFGGTCDDSRAYTGFLLKSSSTNITGTVSVYGLAIA